MTTYEQQLDANFDWALREGSMHFDKSNAVHKTLRGITQRLDELGIPYAVVGGMALFYHGYRRFTEDVDLLVTAESLQRIHDALDGLGYIQPFEKSKSLRDAETGVRIEFLVSGQYPGDGKPKPVEFPVPGKDEAIIDGMRFLGLPRMIELKLASGMTNAIRMRDLADVIALIQELGLSEDFTNKLNPFVRDKYLELWRAVRDNPREV
jgi:hypothetical protein